MNMTGLVGVESFASAGISLSHFLTMIKPLSLFIVGMTIYAMFVFKFYLFFSKRDILKMNSLDSNPGLWGFLKKLAKVSGHAVADLIFIPILVFFWFAVMSILLSLLSKNNTPDTIMIIAMSIVATVRITSFYNEDLSKDLAKMIPFTLLGVFLIDISFFSLGEAIDKISLLSGYWLEMLYYLVFVVVLELILRIITFFFEKAKGK